MSHIHFSYALADLELGDHLCCFYEKEAERQAALTPFLRQGLERGEKVLYIADAHTTQKTMGYLQDAGLEVHSHLDRGQLFCFDSDDAHMQGDAFNPDRLIAVLKAEMTQALTEGYSVLRVAGEMTWASGNYPGADQLAEYETKLNHFFDGNPCLALCQYDRRRFDPQVLLEVLCAHPIAIVGTLLCDNFYYIPPIDPDSSNLPAAKLDYWLQNLTEHKRVDEALQRSEALYRGIVNTMQDGLTLIEEGEIVFVSDRACEIFGYPKHEYVKMMDLDFAAPEERQRLQQVWETVKQTDAPPKELEFWIIRQDGARRRIQNRYTSIHNGNDGIGRLVVTTDVTERKHVEETLERRIAQLALLNEIGGEIAALSKLDKVLERAARLVQERFGYHHVGLFTLDRERNELVMRARIGIFAHLFAPDHRLKLGQGMVGWVGHHGKRLLANDVNAEPHYVNLYPDLVPTQSELSVPIRVGAEIVGVLDIQSPHLNAFDENDVMVMETLADQIAVAIDNARLYEAVQQELIERERAEEALRRSEDQYRTIFETTGNATIIIEEDTTISLANAEFEMLSGYSKEELEGKKSWADFVMADDLKRMKTYHRLRRINPQAVPRNYEFRFVDRRGNVRDIFATIAMIPDTKKSVASLLDITERKLAEEALQKSEARYRTLVEQVPAVTYITALDKVGTTLYISPQAATYLGYSQEEWQTNPDLWRQRLHPDDYRRVMGQLARSHISGEPFIAEYRMVTPDERVVWFRDEAVVVRDDTGQPLFLQGIRFDITERMRARDVLRRTERLAAMGRLAAALAHEINNPLQAIRSNLELVLDFDLEPDEQDTYMQVCRREIERLAEITQRVLSFARPARDTRHSVSIADLAQRTLTLVGKQLQHAHVRVTTDFPDDLPPILVAPDQIVQVLLNVVINAAEVMPDGGLVHIAAREIEEQIMLTLTNNGPPIATEHIEHVFDPFFTTKPSGTGLGLSICYRIVQGHDGTIRVENLSNDRGVRVTITLPTTHTVKLQETVT